MHITCDINENIKVNIHLQPKKKAVDSKTYDIYLHFTISENGVSTITPAVISTGKRVPKNDWDKKQKRMKGRNQMAELINSELFSMLKNAQVQLQILCDGKPKSCTQVRDFISTTLKTKITGKAPRGKKAELISKQKAYTIDAVLENLLEKRELSDERKRIYRHAIGFLHSYYDNKTPLIINIDKKQLQEFETWFDKNVKVSRGKRKGQPVAQDSKTTWFTMIAAVFMHAYKDMNILNTYPLPVGFRGSFSDIVKPVLSEADSLKLVEIPDSTLSKAKQIAKYCLIVQLTTGIGFGDLKSLKLEHRKFDNDLKKWYIEKVRNKHSKVERKKTFRVFLTERALEAFGKLRELTPGEGTYFKLTTHNNINKHYDELTKLAGVTVHTRTYTLRHSFSVEFMNNDGTLEDLGEMIGNDIRNTRKYGRISNKRLAQKATDLEKKSLLHQV